MYRACTFATIFPLLVSLMATGAEPVKASSDQVRRLIDQLNHDDFAIRERAAAYLTKAGNLAIRPLAEGTISSNPEVAWRCSEALERMAMEGDEATMDQVVNVLGDLAKRGKPGLSQFASQMRDRQKTFRHNRAATELRKLGAAVSGGEQQFAEADFGGGLALPAVELAAVDFIIDDVAPIDLDLPLAPDVELEKFPVAEAKPAWLELLEALKIVEPAKKMEIADGTSNVIELDDPARPAFGEGSEWAGDEAEKPTPKKPEPRPSRGIGDAIRKALGIDGGAVEAVLGRPHGEEPALAGPVKELPAPRDFELPDLVEKFPAAPAADVEIVEVVELDAGIDVPAFAPAAMPIFIGGMMAMSEDGSIPGYLQLSKGWRGGDAGLKHLKDLSGVTNLQIEHAELTDGALPHIAKMSSLKSIQIRGGKFSRDALRTFHRQRADVSIMAMGDGMMGVMGQFNPNGCLLDSVFDGSAAADAGLRAGDKVTKIAGDAIKDFSELTIAVSTRKAGDKLKIVFERDGTEQEVEMTLKPRPPGQ